MDKTLADLRKDYTFIKSKELLESELNSNPIKQFELWFNEALQVDPEYTNAMFLATSTKEGRPSVRTVLLKAFDEGGFIFFTNYSSRKGTELRENPYASILFFWNELERQIRIEGSVEKVTRKESDDYFHKRPFESQIAALASKQSSVLKNREELDNKFEELKGKYEEQIVPLPETWGGYRLVPSKFEFWQGRQNRLHDRIVYTLTNGEWKIERLAP